jgi:hypothetical protein
MKPGSFQNHFCREVISHRDARFPLTPALSPAERENRSRLFGEATAEFKPEVMEFQEDIQQLSPLPAGEGRGEGKITNQNSTLANKL